MIGYFSLLLLLLSSYFFTQLFWPQKIVDFFITFICLMAAQIVVSANMLSYFESLHSLGSWIIIEFLFLLISTLLTYYQNKKNKRPVNNNQFKKSIPFNRKRFISLSSFEKTVFIPLISSVIVIGLMNLYLVFNLAPGNHDSMAGHLARVAYYLQMGSYEFYHANFWAQVVHPRNSTSLFLYSYLVTGNENLTQIVQYISYWITIISVYGISAKAGMNRKKSLFSALISGLLISVLMQATTTQNDLLLTALIGVIVFYFFSFKKTGKKQYLLLASIAITISLGVKASILLALVPVTLIAFWSFNRKEDTLKAKIHYGFYTVFVFLISAILFTLPSGYLFNIQKFGHPLGPGMVRDSHTFESESTVYILKMESEIRQDMPLNFYRLTVCQRLHL